MRPKGGRRTLMSDVHVAGSPKLTSKTPGRYMAEQCGSSSTRAVA